MGNRPRIPVKPKTAVVVSMEKGAVSVLFNFPFKHFRNASDARVQFDISFILRVVLDVQLDPSAETCKKRATGGLFAKIDLETHPIRLKTNAKDSRRGGLDDTSIDIEASPCDLEIGNRPAYRFQPFRKAKTDIVALVVHPTDLSE